MVSKAGTSPSLSIWKTTGDLVAGELSVPGVDQIYGPVFSPDGRTLATASYRDNFVRLWGYPSLSERFAVRLSDEPQGPPSFSADGRTLHGIMGKARTAYSIDISTRKLTEHDILGATDYLYALCYSRDARVLAAGGERGSPAGGGVPAFGDRGVIRLFDAATGKPLREFPHVKEGPVRLAFSPNGRWLASGDSAGKVLIWDTESGKPVSDFTGHRGRISSLVFSPDGKRLASGSEDTTALIWDFSGLQDESK